MTANGSGSRLAEALSSRFDEVIAEWIAAYEGSALRLPKKVGREDVAARALPLLDCISELYRPRRDHAPGSKVSVEFVAGSVELREVERAAAFLGANLGATEATGFDVAALVLSCGMLPQTLCNTRPAGNPHDPAGDPVPQVGLTK